MRLKPQLFLSLFDTKLTHI